MSAGGVRHERRLRGRRADRDGTVRSADASRVRNGRNRRETVFGRLRGFERREYRHGHPAPDAAHAPYHHRGGWLDGNPQQLHLRPLRPALPGLRATPAQRHLLRRGRPDGRHPNGLSAPGRQHRGTPRLHPRHPLRRHRHRRAEPGARPAVPQPALPAQPGRGGGGRHRHGGPGGAVLAGKGGAVPQPGAANVHAGRGEDRESAGEQHAVPDELRGGEGARGPTVRACGELCDGGRPASFVAQTGGTKSGMNMMIERQVSASF
mmetsp:Transcript_4171/g.8708  ORF Transcript_4171/g.8708 Transcript_4171/m.8708 type:complete len:264 (+) Transcript_4171:688-1479(+)